MTNDSEYSLVIWDGKSKGSYSNILRSLEQNKPVKVYMSGNVAVQAELVSLLPGANIHDSNISQQDIETASLLSISRLI